MGCKNLIDSLKDSIDSILGIRDGIGAALKPIFMVTRTWSGNDIGIGRSYDQEFPLTPTPNIVDLSHNIRINPGGRVQHGDILLKGISKNRYPLQSDVDSSVKKANEEKLYKIGDKFYQIISVKENQLTWDVQLRELTYQQGS